MTEIYHQLGHRFKWNLASIIEEGTGDGVIVGPRYMSPPDVLNIPEELRSRSIFDPQFFLPASSRGKLSEYPFHPNVLACGFSTSEWTEENGSLCAEQCMAFQAECGFRYLVAPTRFIDGAPSNYIETQMGLFIKSFLNAFTRLSPRQPLLLQLILTDQMIKEPEFRHEILNWVTGINEFEGVYLIYYVQRKRKQIEDIEFLLGLISFVSALKQAGMSVIIGYQNIESIPLLIADPDVVSIGSYETQRMFNLRAFEEPNEKRIHGPNVRIYLPRLMQWIDHNYTGAISKVVQNPHEYFDENHYRVTMFEPSYNWNFQRPEPYRHFFLVFSRQLRELIRYSGPDRLEAVFQACRRAYEEFQAIESRIFLDTDSGSNHLPAWLTTLSLVKNGERQQP